MRTDRIFCLIAMVVLAAHGCTPNPAKVPVFTSEAPQEVVEVTNRADFAVMVKYYTEAGGPHGLGVVSAEKREVMILPRPDVGHILVQTADGKRIGRNTNLIGIRRYRVDPRTGERIGPVTVIR